MMRIFQASIVCFWLATMVWLAKTILTPDEAGMIQVDPRRPVQTFFSWNDTAGMILLQNGVKLGEVQMVGYPADEDGDPAGFSIALILNGEVETPVMGTFVRGLFRVNPDFSLHSSDFLFRIPSSDFKVLASAKSDGNVTMADAFLGGNKIFSFNSQTSEAIDPGMMGMVKNHPLASELLSNAGDPADWKWQIEAYRGMHKFSGKRLPVYLIKLSLQQAQQSVRFYFSDSGEPLKVETDLGYQAISEMLSPVEKYKLE